MRKRSRIEEKLEKLSVADALNAVRFAEVVVLLMDAEKPFEEQDLRIADLVEREGRALVIAVNKWDLMERQPGLISALRTEADHWLPQVKGVPIVAVSGLMGEGIDRLMTAIQEAYAVWNRRVPTAALNRWFEQAVDANPPPAVSGRWLTITSDIVGSLPSAMLMRPLRSMHATASPIDASGGISSVITSNF